jgi:hypothetical protein
MTDSAITALGDAAMPLCGEATSCIAPCAQNGQNVRVPAAAFGIPVAGVTAPVPLGQFQTWIDLSTTPPTLRMYVERDWIALYALGPDGTLSPGAALALPTDSAASLQAVTKNYIDTRPGPAGSMMFRGTLDCSPAPNYPAANKGDVYIVSASGRIGGASGVNVGAAAMLLCEADATSSGTQADVGAHWAILQGHDGNGVRNSSGAANGNLARFDTDAGKSIVSSGIAFDTDASMAANDDGRVPTQRAVKNSYGGGAFLRDAPQQGDLPVWDGTIASFRATSGPGRNLLVNSSFDIWQEATSYAFGQSLANTHIADFWKVGGTSASPRTARRVAGFSGSHFALQIQRQPGAPDVDNMRIAQQFGREESLFMQGKPLVLSFDLLTGANFSGQDVKAGLTFGTGIDENITLYAARIGGNAFPTGSGTTLPDAQGKTSLVDVYVNTLTAQIPPPGTAVRVVNQPLTIPASWPAGPVSEIALVIVVGPFSGQAGADDGVTIANVKLEIGNVATPYVAPSPEEETASCQRRYRKSFARNTRPTVGVGTATGEHRAPALLAGTGTQSLGTIRFPAMRAVPSVSLYNPFPGDGTSLARDFAAGDCTATTVQNITETGFEIVASGNAATAAGNTFGVHWVADARL